MTSMAAVSEHIRHDSKAGSLLKPNEYLRDFSVGEDAKDATLAMTGGITANEVFGGGTEESAPVQQKGCPRPAALLGVDRWRRPKRAAPGRRQAKTPQIPRRRAKTLSSPPVRPRESPMLHNTHDCSHESRK